MFRKHIKHISLDFDGVLTDSNHDFAREFIAIGLSLTGREISQQSIFDNWGNTIVYLLELFYPEVDIITYTQERERLGFHKKSSPLISRAIETLEILKQRYSLSIVTNRESTTLLEIMKAREINPLLFERIQSSNDTDYDKPDPRVFDDLLIRYSANQVLYVGDHHQADWLAASGAGISFVGVLSGGISTKEDFLDAGVPKNQILSSLAEIPNFIGL